MAVIKHNQYNWKLQSSTQNISQWFDFSEFTPPSINTSNQFLNFPPYTLDIIDYALKNNLSRYDGWKIPNNTLTNSINYAARIYRRGVYTSAQTAPTSEGNYEIIFHSNPAFIHEQLNKNCFLVIDQVFYQLWNNILKLDINSQNICIINSSELEKNLDTCQLIYDHWKISKNKKWLILGGGVLTDTAAFCASLCNCDFDLVPTTLLAMIDAAIGGKTGVNYRNLKNHLGTFAFPQNIHIYTDFLRTLPDEEYHNGFVEAYKHCLIARDQNFAKDLILKFKNYDLDFTDIESIIAIKAKIVAKDSNEKNIRMSLNLGHTLGHALEQICFKNKIIPSLKHGQAVLIGIIYILFLSKNTNTLPHNLLSAMLNQLKDLMNQSTYEKLTYLLNSLGEDFVFQSFLELIQYDKKSSKEQMTWILIEDWSKIKLFKDPISLELLKNSFKSCTDWIRNFKD